MATTNSHKPPYSTSHTLKALDQRYNAQSYSTIATIMALRQTYFQDRFTFMRGEDMVPVLKRLGATDENFRYVKSISNITGLNLDYCTVTHGRYSRLRRTIQRLEWQPYTLPVQEDYCRHD